MSRPDIELFYHKLIETLIIQTFIFFIIIFCIITISHLKKNNEENLLLS